MFVSGEPKAQPRPKARVVSGRAFIYTPDSAEDWKEAIRRELKVRKVKPTDDIWSVEIIFLMPRPKSHYGTGKNSTKLKDDAPFYHEGRPDFDNLAKAVADAMTATEAHPYGYWTDDSKIVSCSILKVYSWKEMPGAIVNLTKLERNVDAESEVEQIVRGSVPQDNDGEADKPAKS